MVVCLPLVDTAKQDKEKELPSHFLGVSFISRLNVSLGNLFLYFFLRNFKNHQPLTLRRGTKMSSLAFLLCPLGSTDGVRQTERERENHERPAKWIVSREGDLKTDGKIICSLLYMSYLCTRPRPVDALDYEGCGHYGVARLGHKYDM